MIDLYTWKTPNGRKASIMLEEIQLPYTVHPVNINNNEQFTPEFLKISPNNKIPAIVDQDGPDKKPLSIFESGAILIYLAEKAGKLLPTSGKNRAATLEWLFWQIGGVGPMFGQLNHFMNAAPESISYAIERYSSEVKRLLKVMNTRLNDAEYLAEEYSIADIAIFPWITLLKRYSLSLDDYQNIKRWHDAIAARPAVQKGMLIPE